MKYSILPKPQYLEERDGEFVISNANISLSGTDDPRVYSAIAHLSSLLIEVSDRAGTLGKNNCESVLCTLDGELPCEGYTLAVSLENIIISGGDDAGIYYGIMTLRSLISQCGAFLPCVYIKDYPSMPHRGFYHDATRGRVPTVNGVKKLIDCLTALKVNSLQLYIEHTFDFKEFGGNRDCDCLTAEDILEIDRYAYEHFIDFVPSLSTFGHLYELLSRAEYKHLCELEKYSDTWHFWRERMAHHTIDPSDPESEKMIFSLIDQYLPLFSSKYFNICCDETFDLGCGKNKGCDKGGLYCDFVQKITRHVKAAGKTVMMWGDIALSYPSALENIPQDTILLNWDYSADPYLGKISRVAEAGLSQIVCPGTASWARLFENPAASEQNITKMARSGYENGAFGILNTNWGDYGHPCHAECAFYGMSVGAAVGWNIGTELDEEFELAVSRVTYGIDKNIVPLLRELGRAHGTAQWVEIFDYEASGDEKHIKASPENIIHSIAVCEVVISELSALEDKNGIFRYIINAAHGIVILDRAVYIIKTGEGDRGEWKRDAEAWLSEYREMWLSGNKESELSEIEKFVRAIL